MEELNNQQYFLGNTEGGATSNSSSSSGGGGGGLVGSIVGVVGDVFSFFSKREERKIAYQEWLNNSIPEFKWFADSEKITRNYLIVIGIIAFLLAIVLILTVLQKS